MGASLNSEPRKLLSELVAEFGMAIADDERRCRNLLNDRCGRYKAEVNLLVNALRERIPVSLRTDSGGVPELVLGQLERRMQANLSITGEAARWAVRSWAKALGTISPPVPGLGRIRSGLRMEQLLEQVNGIGPPLATILGAHGFCTIADLLGHIPFRYEDRSNVKTLAQLSPGELSTAIAKVQSVKTSGRGLPGAQVFEARFTDTSQTILVGKWIDGGSLGDVLAEGQRVAVYGELKFDRRSGELVMWVPEFELLADDDDDDEGLLHHGVRVPIYEGIGRLTSRMLRILMHRVLESLSPEEEALPRPLVDRLQMPDRRTAIRRTHFPAGDSDLVLVNAFRSSAQFRLIFEDFFWLECAASERRRQPGIEFELGDRVRARIKAMLSTRPTGGQKRVLGEIARDMMTPFRMRRLLQGDSGSGKMTVAMEAAVIAIENGYQVAVLAPNEILAHQRHRFLAPMLANLGYSAVLVTESDSPEQSARHRTLIAEGLVNVVIGTLALQHRDVKFDRLGLVVVDEVSRFGDEQRFGLATNGADPDVLMLTAAPTPPYLLASLAGFVDRSINDEMLPGHNPVLTRHVSFDRVEETYSFLRSEVQAGRQAYVVYPTAGDEAGSFEQLCAHLSREVFPDIPVGIFHERLSRAEMAAAIDAFAQGHTKIMISTGAIDGCAHVPDATAIAMVLDRAEGVGLLKLHRLRSLVGRGSLPGHCISITKALSDEGREVIRAFVDYQDGWSLAEWNLRLTGLDFTGMLQFANMLRDGEIADIARREAKELFARPASDGDLLRSVRYLREHPRRRFEMFP
jgi:ATP-dependent DNA helicase RecG